MSRKHYRKPAKATVENAIAMADEADLPDGAHWALVHELLGLKYGDVFDLLEEYGIVVPVRLPEREGAV